MKLLLGNEVLALGLIEQKCRVITAYPGTPSSEILSNAVKYKKDFDYKAHIEWSINEKVAFETVLAASWVGVRAAVAMKQVGLNVASDPFFSSAYTGVKGGFIIISADDPGPHSSQTEQDSRLISLTAKVPVFDPSSPSEVYAMIEDAFIISEKYKIPVLIRPVTRLCHALQTISVKEKAKSNDIVSKVEFQKNPKNWTATPKLRFLLHTELNKKLTKIENEFEDIKYNFITNKNSIDKVGIIASGVVFHTAKQVLKNLGLNLPMLKIGTPYPLPKKLANNFIKKYKEVLVLEETNCCLELQILNREKVRGRLDETVPKEGELSPEIVSSILIKILKKNGYKLSLLSKSDKLKTLIDKFTPPMYPPRLCPGCSHRSAFFAIKSEFGDYAIYPGDIGCYTLGTNLEAVDTFLNMGASIGMAQGFYHTNKLMDDKKPIIATIGDSTFLHSGIPPLVDSVHTDSKFILVILNNNTTAMTGFQPTAESKILADGSKSAQKIDINDLVKACNINFLREVDPYDYKVFRKTLRDAYNHTLEENGNVAVIIAKRPCVIQDKGSFNKSDKIIIVQDSCDGCCDCIKNFECPALMFNNEKGYIDINYDICTNCGQCIVACPKGCIIKKMEDFK
ncbi:MAG: indolepyruvate oxidoreductase [Bacteroidetes bacterium]|nr:indolepyruvate oxidoreductase [Bacteroidota bacterium]